MSFEHSYIVLMNNRWNGSVSIAKIIKFASPANPAASISVFYNFFLFCVINVNHHRLSCCMELKEFQNEVYPLKNKLFRFAKRILDHTEEAEDVVQEAFIKLWNRRESLDKYRSIEALAMISVKNLCLDKIKIKRFPVENFDNHRGFLENLSGDEKNNNEDLVEEIHQAIKKLPEQQQMILHLRDIEGYSFEEMAGIVKMNENAIRVALSRARKRVRELMIKTKEYEYQGN